MASAASWWPSGHSGYGVPRWTTLPPLPAAQHPTPTRSPRIPTLLSTTCPSPHCSVRQHPLALSVQLQRSARRYRRARTRSTARRRTVFGRLSCRESRPWVEGGRGREWTRWGRRREGWGMWSRRRKWGWSGRIGLAERIVRPSGQLTTEARTRLRYCHAHSKKGSCAAMSNLLSAIHQAVRKLYRRPIGKARNACFSSRASRLLQSILHGLIGHPKANQAVRLGPKWRQHRGT